MRLYSKRKILFLVPAACIAFLVIFSAVLIAEKHEHDCVGEDCPVCLQIEAADCFLKTLKLTVIGLLLIVRSTFSVQFNKERACLAPCFLSPVALKVRFNS